MAAGADVPTARPLDGPTGLSSAGLSRCHLERGIGGRRMTTIAVLVRLKEGVRPEDYERWVLESYAPAVRGLPSVEDWRDYRVNGLLGSDAVPPYRYVVTLEVGDLEQLGRDMAGEEMQSLFSELHRFAEVTQLMSERF